MKKPLIPVQKIHPENIWVVIPTYNEAKYIGAVLEKVALFTNNTIVVDDGSTDSSHRIAKRHVKHVLRHRLNLGKGAALKTGCEYAFNELGAEAVIFMDSDDQHDPVELEQFTTELKDGAEIVFGERAMSSEMPLIRIILNRLASVIVYVLFGAYVPDIPSGYKAITRTAYEQIAWQSTGYEVELEIAVRVAKAKIPFEVVPIQTIYHDMDHGMSPTHAFKMWASVLWWRLTL